LKHTFCSLLHFHQAVNVTLSTKPVSNLLLQSCYKTDENSYAPTKKPKALLSVSVSVKLFCPWMKFETLSTRCSARDQNLPTFSKIYRMMVISSSWMKTLSKIWLHIHTYTLELNFSHIIKKLPNTCCVTVAVFIVMRWFVVRLHGRESRKQKLLLRLLFTQLFLKPKIWIYWCMFGFIYVLMDINTL